MKRNCDFCGRLYEAKRESSRFCQTKCRIANHQSPRPKPPPPQKKPSASKVNVALVTTTRRELEQVGRLDTVLGQQAMTLAGRIAAEHETGAAVASLSKEFRAVMEAALEGVGLAANPLDELRARRDRKRAAG